MLTALRYNLLSCSRRKRLVANEKEPREELHKLGAEMEGTAAPLCLENSRSGFKERSFPGLAVPEEEDVHKELAEMMHNPEDSQAEMRLQPEGMPDTTVRLQPSIGSLQVRVKEPFDADDRGC